MTDIDFYVDALVSERVHGVGPGSTADEIEGVLGGGFVDDARKQWMRRDYGLVEFQFNRAKSAWICFGISIQVHRLAESGPEVIPSVLSDRYGVFGTSLNLDHLADALGVKGGSELEREEAAGEFVRYRVNRTNSFVHTRQAQQGSARVGRQSEEVWSIEIRVT